MNILEHSDAKLIIQYRPYIPLLSSGTGCLVALLMAVAVALDLFQAYAFFWIIFSILCGIAFCLTDVVICTAYSTKQMVTVDKRCLLRRRKYRFHTSHWEDFLVDKWTHEIK
ncbi:MAG: hypothetical protein AAF579_07155 [Cyanobacteria bacterium P01_C01_bin.118]